MMFDMLEVERERAEADPSKVTAEIEILDWNKTKLYKDVSDGCA